MIRAEVFRKKGRITGFSLRDHADSTDDRYDLICASVSTMFITTVNGIEEIVKAEAEVKANPGDSSLYILENDAEKLEKADVLLNTFELGLKNLSEEYPTYVKLIISEEKND